MLSWVHSYINLSIQAQPKSLTITNSQSGLFHGYLYGEEIPKHEATVDWHTSTLNMRQGIRTKYHDIFFARHVHIEFAIIFLKGCGKKNICFQENCCWTCQEEIQVFSHFIVLFVSKMYCMVDGIYINVKFLFFTFISVFPKRMISIWNLKPDLRQ